MRFRFSLLRNLSAFSQPSVGLHRLSYGIMSNNLPLVLFILWGLSLFGRGVILALMMATFLRPRYPVYQRTRCKDNNIIDLLLRNQ